MQHANRIAPTLAPTNLRGKRARAAAGWRRASLAYDLVAVDVAVGRHHIVIAGQHHWHVGGHQLRGVRREPVQPGKLVFEFRPGLLIAVGRVQRGDQRAVDGRFDVAALSVFGVTRKFSAGDDRLAVASQNGDAGAAFLPAPRRGITRLPPRRGFEELADRAASSSCRQSTSGFAARK